MTKPRADEPKPKSSIYDKTQWMKEPKQKAQHPDKVAQKHYFSQGDTLDSIAKKYGMSWRALTRYNWGTAKEEYVNWYLHSHCGCEDLTPSGNYYFKPAGLPWLRSPLSPEFVWVYKPKPPPPTHSAPAPRRQQCTYDTCICPHNLDGNCSLDRANGGPPVCIPPYRKAKKANEECDGEIKLGSAGNRQVRHREVQRVRKLRVTLAHYWIFRLKRPHGGQTLLSDAVLSNPGSYEADSHELISFLQFDLGVATAIELIPPELRDNANTQANRSKTRERIESRAKWTGKEPVKDPTELEAVAIMIRNLQDAEVLKRVKVFGFADASETADPDEGRELGGRRALWVVRELIDRYRLLLTIEPSKRAPTPPQAAIDLHNSELKAGYVPVTIMECGEIFAPPGKEAKEWRRVDIEVVVREEGGGKPSRAPKPSELQAIHTWYTYESFKGKSRDRMLVHAYGNQHNGLALGPLTVGLFREEALGYIGLLSQTAGGKLLPSVDWQHICDWVLSWDYNAKFRIPKLTDRFHATGYGGVLKPFQDAYAAPLEWIEKVAEPGQGNHRRELVWLSAADESDDMRLESLERHFMLPVPCEAMRVEFKPGEPKQ